MQQQVDSHGQPNAPEATGAAGYSVNPSGIHATLVDVAADGQSLAQAAKAARDCGDAAAGSFGTATAVAAAFKGFWSGREDVGERIASLLFRKADAVSAAASAFVEADHEMTATASAALAKLPAGYAPHHRGGFRAVQ
ncbi:DUF6507 family protein [Arthrobacter citreus]|uniref:DUF6507 family protein n=1 Tax=Arthrobacter TaxID=1663 RepID=UPI001264E41C|nr:DUF6507 family protein [Arthrobacter gandavensis]